MGIAAYQVLIMTLKSNALLKSIAIFFFIWLILILIPHKVQSCTGSCTTSSDCICYVIETSTFISAYASVLVSLMFYCVFAKEFSLKDVAVAFVFLYLLYAGIYLLFPYLSTLLTQLRTEDLVYHCINSVCHYI